MFCAQATKNENESTSSEGEDKEEASGGEGRRSQSSITAAMKTRIYRRRRSRDQPDLKAATNREEIEGDTVRVEDVGCDERKQETTTTTSNKDSRLLAPFSKHRRRGTHTTLKYAIRRARKRPGEPALASEASESNEHAASEAVT
ncbi:unnamed protein product [Schistocephalus solidus]|uniref:Uncharacterized protein n=1 Tax=Schistocephalus solidus TaxID=70667 RepID=A0A3P7F1X2_SCHSO|nr:unnamed protein product [Schistocephalus solidus]